MTLAWWIRAVLLSGPTEYLGAKVLAVVALCGGFLLVRAATHPRGR